MIRKAATKIAHLVKDEFPLAPVYARAYDRAHALALIRAGVDYQLREVFESAVSFGAETLRLLGEEDETIEEVWRKCGGATGNVWRCS